MQSRYFSFKLPVIEDGRGSMCVIEALKQVPFKIERVFYDFNNKKNCEIRGNHANLNSSFAFICISGKCEILLDDGFERKKFLLDDPSMVLVAGKLVWKEMNNFSPDSVLLILSDKKYDKNEYIRNYDEFIKYLENLK